MDEPLYLIKRAVYSDGTVETYRYGSTEPVEIHKREPLIEPPLVRKRKCKRCDYTWVPRKKQKPVQCPECKSPYWNKERVKKNTSK
jgi:ribosomal protein L37AE/L43A